jgi:hypothetical protein
VRQRLRRAAQGLRSLLNNAWFIALVGGVIAAGIFALGAWMYTQLF